MLENYYRDQHGINTNDEHKRLLAVKAALEVIKAATENDSVYLTTAYIQSDLAKTADAIQEALKSN